MTSMSGGGAQTKCYRQLIIEGILPDLILTEPRPSSAGETLRRREQTEIERICENSVPLRAPCCEKIAWKRGSTAKIRTRSEITSAKRYLCWRQR